MPVEQGQSGVKTEMAKFKAGELHSGSNSGPVVRNRKQAIAISMKEAGLSKPNNLKNRNSSNKSGMSNKGRTY